MCTFCKQCPEVFSSLTQRATGFVLPGERSSISFISHSNTLTQARIPPSHTYWVLASPRGRSSNASGVLAGCVTVSSALVLPPSHFLPETYMDAPRRLAVLKTPLSHIDRNCIPFIASMPFLTITFFSGGQSANQVCLVGSNSNDLLPIALSEGPCKQSNTKVVKLSFRSAPGQAGQVALR